MNEYEWIWSMPFDSLDGGCKLFYGSIVIFIIVKISIFCIYLFFWRLRIASCSCGGNWEKPGIDMLSFGFGCVEVVKGILGNKE